MAHAKCKKDEADEKAAPDYPLKQHRIYVESVRRQAHAKNSELEAAEAKLVRMEAGSPG